MSGELAPLLGRSWKEVWLPLARSKSAPADLYSELVRELVPAPQAPAQPPTPPPNAFDEAGELVDPVHQIAHEHYKAAMARHAEERDEYEVAVASGDGRPLFRKHLLTAGRSEARAVQLFEGAHEALAVFGDEMQTRYRELVKSFFANHNLAYEVRAEFHLYPTMPGMFARILREVRNTVAGDQHLQQLYSEFEEAFADLKSARTEARLKTCLLRQFNLIEALGRSCPGVTAQTLGAICDQRQWPHATIKDVGKKLYGFRSDYPGLGHAGNPQAVLGPLSLKDFVSISLMLASFTPYFVEHLDAERCYGG